MRIGIDVDGVLSDFCSAFINLLREEGAAGVPDVGPDFPDEWNFAEKYATNEQINSAWQRIMAVDEEFWLSLPVLAAKGDTDALTSILNRHDCYFITSRVGEDARSQTESWLWSWLNGYRENFAVLIADSAVAKGHLIRGLSLDCFIDDNTDNVRMAEFFGRPCGTKVFLCDRPWNRSYNCPDRIRRVSGIKEMMEIMEGSK